MLASFQSMRITITSLLAIVAVGCLAQEQSIPVRLILPEDVEQGSIQTVRVATNGLAVRFTYTEAGARKMLAFRREHAGQEIVMRVGDFEHRTVMASLETKPVGWTEEGWLKQRTDKFFAVSEADAKKIAAGLSKK